MKPLLLLLFASSATLGFAQTPLTLEQCIQRATTRNVQVRQLDNTRQRQQLTLHSVQHARLPQVGASVGENISFGRGLTANNTYEARNTSSTSLSVGASIPLLTGGRIGHEQQQARLQLAALVADVEQLRENLALQVAQAYLQTLYQHDLAQQAQDNLRFTQTQADRLRQSIAAGKVAAVELAEALSRIAQDSLALTQSQNDYRLALLELSQLLEMPSPDSLSLLPPTDAQLPLMSGTPEETYLLSLGHRPSLRAADLRWRAAQQGVSIARSGYYPTLSLTAGVGSSYYNTSGFPNLSFGRQLRDNFSQSIGLSLSIPIFNGVNTRNQVRQARLEVAQQLLRREEIEKSLYKEIQNAYYNARAAHEKHKAATAAEHAAMTALNSVTQKHAAGKATLSEVDQLTNKYRSAATQRIAARYELLFRSKIWNFYRGETIR